MSKILYAASVPVHLQNFHVPYIDALVGRGDEVWVLCGEAYSQEGVARSVVLPMKKNLLSPVNLRSAFRAAGLLKRERFDLICVHTSLAAFVLRLAVLLAGKGKTRVVNVVHGYLFDEKTQPVLRLLMLGAEKLLRSVTDRVAVMNRCDLAIAEKYRLGAEVVEIPGVGVDFSRFAPGDREKLRQSLGLGEDSLLLLFAGEFSGRKNQAFLIRAMAGLPENVCLALPGQGQKLEDCRRLAGETGVADRVFFPGQRSDLGDWYAAADICVSASRYEGLPFNIMEGMYAGKPVAASRVKGHTDLVSDGVGGFLFDWGDGEAYCQSIRTLAKDPALRASMGEKNRELVLRYGRDRVFSQVLEAMTGEKTPPAE
jgi:glycosyltransferase EpsD